jgi:hypothetical protein
MALEMLLPLMMALEMLLPLFLCLPTLSLSHLIYLFPYSVLQALELEKEMEMTRMTLSYSLDDSVLLS